MAPSHPTKAGISPSRRDQMAFMAMMDSVIQTQIPCNCSTCNKRPNAKVSTNRRSTSNHNEFSTTSNSPFSSSSYKHLCPEHRELHADKQSPSIPTEKTKQASTTANSNRNDKVNSLLKAETVQAVFDVFKLTPTTAEEKDLSQRVQAATAECKLFADTRSKIIELCSDNETNANAVFGLLAKFRQERNLLTTAIIKSNSEREKSSLAVQRVDHLMYMLQDFAKEGKDSKGAELKGNLGNIILEIHELAKTPSVLYDELIDLREEHLDLLADHEEEHQKFLDIESCHEALHEKNKKLIEDHSQLMKDYTEAKKKFSTLGALKTDLAKWEKQAEEANDKNLNLEKEVEKLTSELTKLNALKHENSQLKKKLATIEVGTEEFKQELNQSVKKKKGKKGGASAASAEPNLDAQKAPTPESDLKLQEELKNLRRARDDLSSELDLVRGSLAQFEMRLKKAEAARDRALEKQQLEQATSQNWKELSDNHSEEGDRLRQKLKESQSKTTMLQNAVQKLEQSLADKDEQLRNQAQDRTVSPAIDPHSMSPFKPGSEMVRLLQKVRTDTEQLARDLDEARSYSGDPRNVIAYTTKVVTEIDQDLDNVLSGRGRFDGSGPSLTPETYVPYRYANSASSQSPAPHTGSRFPDASPSLSSAGSVSMPVSSLPSYRPMPPPSLIGLNNENPFGNPTVSIPAITPLPAPVGTGRPTGSRNNTQASKASNPSPVSAASSNHKHSSGGLGSAIGNGASGVNWSIWTRPQER